VCKSRVDISSTINTRLITIAAALAYVLGAAMRYRIAIPLFSIFIGSLIVRLTEAR
jgi:hypothetical protein